MRGGEARDETRVIYAGDNRQPAYAHSVVTPETAGPARPVSPAPEHGPPPPSQPSRAAPRRARRTLAGCFAVMALALIVFSFTGPDVTTGQSPPLLELGILGGWMVAPVGCVIVVAWELSDGWHWGPVVLATVVTLVGVARMYWPGQIEFLVLLWCATLLAWGLWLGFTGLGRRCRWRLGWWIQLIAVPLLAAATVFAALNDGEVYLRALVNRSAMNQVAQLAPTVPAARPGLDRAFSNTETCDRDFCYSDAYRQGEYVTIRYPDLEDHDGLVHGFVKSPQQPGNPYFAMALPPGRLIDLRDLGGDWYYWAYVINIG